MWHDVFLWLCAEFMLFCCLCNMCNYDVWSDYQPGCDAGLNCGVLFTLHNSNIVTTAITEALEGNNKNMLFLVFTLFLNN